MTKREGKMISIMVGTVLLMAFLEFSPAAEITLLYCLALAGFWMGMWHLLPKDEAKNEEKAKVERKVLR
jgi:hypothetical protein